MKSDIIKDKQDEVEKLNKELGTISDRIESLVDEISKLEDEEEDPDEFIEKIQKDHGTHEQAIDLLKTSVHTAMAKLIEYSEQTGVPFDIDPWRDFGNRAYLPKKFLSVIDEYEKLIGDAGESTEFIGNFVNYNYNYNYYEGPKHGWVAWSSSSLFC